MIIGGASCVWDDVAAWERTYGRSWDGITIAVNDVGAHWPRSLDHWVSLHAHKIAGWRQLRASIAMPPCTPTTWSQELRWTGDPALTDRTLLPWGFGSSGLLGVQVAQAIGCTHVILCGIPMTDSEHFAQTREAHGSRWLAAGPSWRAWLRNQSRLLGWTKSMSGRTRELLGEPTYEWLHCTDIDLRVG